MNRIKKTPFDSLETNGVFTSARGFEPPTYRLGGGRSILLSYVDIFSAAFRRTNANIAHFFIKCKHMILVYHDIISTPSSVTTT